MGKDPGLVGGPKYPSGPYPAQWSRKEEGRGREEQSATDMKPRFAVCPCPLLHREALPTPTHVHTYMTVWK